MEIQDLKVEALVPTALPLWRKFPFERIFLENEENLKEKKFERNVKEIYIS